MSSVGSTHYSLTKAANILQVKRDLLVTFEQYLPALRTCSMRPSAEHYTNEDFTLLQSLVCRMKLEGLRVHELITVYLRETHGIVHAHMDTKHGQSVGSAQKVADKSHSIRTRRTRTMSTDDLQMEDQPAEWYYNKLYSESQGQMSFNFDNPDQSYTTVDKGLAHHRPGAVAEATEQGGYGQTDATGVSSTDPCQQGTATDQDSSGCSDKLNLSEKLSLLENLVKTNKIHLSSQGSKDLSAILPTLHKDNNSGA